LAIAIGYDPSFSKDIEALAKTLERGGSGQIVEEFAREVAEAELDLLRIRKLKPVRFNTIFGNPEAKLQDYSELSETLAQLERYEPARFHGASVLCSRCAKNQMFAQWVNATPSTGELSGLESIFTPRTSKAFWQNEAKLFRYFDTSKPSCSFKRPLICFSETASA